MARAMATAMAMAAMQQMTRLDSFFDFESSNACSWRGLWSRGGPSGARDWSRGGQQRTDGVGHKRETRQ